MKGNFMKRIIISPQKFDMGCGFGKFSFDKETTLKQFLEHYKKTCSSWGTITIIKADGDILRKFDYDMYNDSIFYYNLSWELQCKVKKIIFNYCFMNENVDIRLERYGR